MGLCRRVIGVWLAGAVTASLLQVPSIVTSPVAAAETSTPAAALTEEQASEQAKRLGRPVEVTSMLKEHSEVQALPTGGFEVTQHVQPVRTRKGGAWVDIDTDLVRAAGGVVPKATTVDLRFSDGGSDALVTMSRGGREVSLSWPQELPEPVLEGDTAVYRSVLGADVDLRLRADAGGFAHTLVVKTAEAARDPRLAELNFKLDTAGLSPSQEASGALKVTDTESGAEVFEAPVPMMWDSTVAGPGAPAASEGAGAEAPSSDGPGTGSRTAELQVGLEGGSLTLRPDQGLLSSPDTKYPVFIDPVWDTTKASYKWTMVSSGYPNESYYRFTGTEGVGFCKVSLDSRCVKDQKKRIMFRMPLPSIAGKYIEAVEFVAYETSAYDCKNPTWVRLYRVTPPFNSSSTWNTTADNWGEVLASRDVAYCSRTPVEFGGTTLRSHVRSAINSKHGTISFGLQAYNESSMNYWKRFDNDAYLKILYNNPPKQPDTAKMYSSPGTPCKDKPAAEWVGNLPTLYSVLVDPDAEDAKKVQGQFQLSWANNADGSDWGAKWTAPLTAPQTTGTKFKVKVPDGVMPVGKLIDWHVRAWDGAQWGPWSYEGAATGCFFYYDPTVPAAPVITSTDYPNDEQPRDGAGRAGDFVIDDPTDVAVRYDISVNGQPVKSVATTAGAPQTVALTPNKTGPNQVKVQSFTAAHLNSESDTYTFHVSAGKAENARFKLDEPAGSTSVAALTRDGQPPVSAQVQGGAALAATDSGQDGTGLRLDGSSGFAVADGPVIDTTKSFAVSAWVRLKNGTGSRTAVSIDGTRKSGFYLQHKPASGSTPAHWAFSMTAADSDAAGWYEASSPANTKVRTPVGEWAHLVGVYDQTLNRQSLLVNGEPAGSVLHEGVWQAAGPLVIGRGKWLGAAADHWAGDIDDVRVFDRVLGQEEAKDLFSQHPVKAGRWKLNTGGADDSGENRPLNLKGGATIDPGAGFAFLPGAGMLLNGTTAYAETTTPVVDTNRSFTITGWVRNSGRPASPVTVFSQAGTNTNAFALRYKPGADPGTQGDWEIEMTDADQAGKDPLTVTHSGFTEGDWNHVAIVYNGFSDTMSLYVDGQMEAHETHVSEKGGVRSFQGTNGGLQVGRSKLGGTGGTQFWPDAIDDVWAYQGALGTPQIQMLAGQVELDTDTGP